MFIPLIYSIRQVLKVKHTYFIGYWKKGKLDGVVKCLIGKDHNYGIWNKGKKERVIKDEKEFKKIKDFNIEKYSILFKFNIKMIKDLMEIDDDE